MPTSSETARQIDQLVTTLQRERRQHEQAVAKIDATFDRLGIKAGAAAGQPSAEAPAKRPAKGRSRRTRYARTAEQFILDLLGRGRKLSSAAINEAWRKAGRGGGAANTLTKLVQDGKLVREKIAGSRGSSYRKA